MIGKSPLFEICKMDAENNDPLKFTPVFSESYLEESDMTMNDEKDSEVESDEEDEDYLPIHFKKQSAKKCVNKRSLPICVYTYKVNY